MTTTEARRESDFDILVREVEQAAQTTPPDLAPLSVRVRELDTPSLRRLLSSTSPSLAFVAAGELLQRESSSSGGPPRFKP